MAQYCVDARNLLVVKANIGRRGRSRRAALDSDAVKFCLFVVKPDMLSPCNEID